MISLGGLFGQRAKEEIEHVRVTLIGGGFIDNSISEIVWLSVRSWYFYKGVDVSNTRYVVRYEGFEFEVELNILWLVSLNEFKYVFDVTADGQVSKSSRIVTTDISDDKAA